MYYIDGRIWELHTMTKLLEKAFAAAGNLSETEQDALAAIILEELTDDERWSKAFSNSQQQLAKLAKEALEEYKSGRTKPLDP